jgi:hypothetical protein
MLPEAGPDHSKRFFFANGVVIQLHNCRFRMGFPEIPRERISVKNASFIIAPSRPCCRAASNNKQMTFF